MPTEYAPDMQAQMERLFATLAEHGTRHLAEAEADLDQTGTLLGEAIIMLSASFMNLHSAVFAQQEQLAMLLAGQQLNTEHGARLQELAEAVRAHANAAVTGLQFQDLTNQLIDRTAKRLAGVREMLAEIGAAAQVVGIVGGDRAATRLEQTTAILGNRSSALDEKLWKTVRQKDMSRGDIELF